MIGRPFVHRAPEGPDRPRVLLAAIALQVLAHLATLAVLGISKVVEPAAGAAVGSVVRSAATGLAIAAAILVLLVLAGVGLARRRIPARAVGPMALGAAIAAQAVLVAGTGAQVVREVQAGFGATAFSPAAFPGPASADAALGVLVFALTVGAWIALRPSSAVPAPAAETPSPPVEIPAADSASAPTGPQAPPPAVPRALARGTVLGLAAVLVVATGGAAEASRSTSPVTCADVTRGLGISFRGALGNAVVDGSDTSVLMQQNMGNGVAVGDYNRDGNLDVYLLGQPGHVNTLYRNDHTATHDGFTDVTDAAGLGGFTGSRAAQFVDLDNDGLVDLVAVNDFVPGTPLQPSRIYRNAGDGTFTDVTGGSGFDPVGVIVGGLGIADYNHDGLPDILVTYWAGGMEMGSTYGSHNLLFQNLGGFRFRDVTVEAGLGTMSTGSFTPVFADLNGDGWPDLYIAVDGAPEALFINHEGTFRDATAKAGLGTIRNGMGAALVDPEGTGLPSIYVTNITEPDHKLGTPPGGDALLRSRLGTGGVAYVDAAAGAGVRDAGWAWGATFPDLNLDGWPDLVVAQGMQAVTRGVSATLTNDRLHVFAGTGAGTFSPVTDNGCDMPGDQRAVVAFDYNRDGRPDLIVSQVKAYATLLENVSERAGHWLTIVADPTPGHTVVGAKITVTAGGRRWTQVLLGGGGYLSGPPNEAYFGLGAADRVTDVTIDWPDGTVTSRSDLAVDRLRVMAEP